MERSENNSYLGYNTYVLGTVKSVIDCLGIIVYNKDELVNSENIEKISIYNIDQVIRSLRTTGKYYSIIRDNADDPFHYSLEEGGLDDMGFNTIIYLSNTDGLGIGYTEFINYQGQYRDLNISLRFTSELKIDLNFRINNILTSLQNSGVSRDFSGKDLWNYTTVGDIRKTKTKGNRLLFSTHLSSLLSKNKESNVWMDYGVVRKGAKNMNNLVMSNSISVDPYDNNFESRLVGYFYGGDIAYYSWAGLKYSIYSLCKVNRFGNPTNYTGGTNLGYYEIQNAKSGEYIYTFSGRYAIIRGGNETRYYDTVERKWVVKASNDSFLIDALDPTSKLRPLPRVPYYSNLISYFPELNNTFFDIESLGGGNNYINLVKKYGNWFVISQSYSGGEAVHIYSNPFLAVKVKPEEEVIFLNDYFVMIRKENGNIEVFTELGKVWESEKVIEFLYRGEELENKKQERNKDIEEEKIQIIPNNIPIYNTWLKRFQRGSIPYNLSTPPSTNDIIGAFGGIIFYKTSDKRLSYL